MRCSHSKSPKTEGNVRAIDAIVVTAFIRYWNTRLIGWQHAKLVSAWVNTKIKWKKLTKHWLSRALAWKLNRKYGAWLKSVNQGYRLRGFGKPCWKIFGWKLRCIKSRLIPNTAPSSICPWSITISWWACFKVKVQKIRAWRANYSGQTVWKYRINKTLPFCSYSFKVFFAEGLAVSRNYKICI